MITVLERSLLLYVAEQSGCRPLFRQALLARGGSRSVIESAAGVPMRALPLSMPADVEVAPHVGEPLPEDTWGLAMRGLGEAASVQSLDSMRMLKGPAVRHGRRGGTSQSLVGLLAGRMRFLAWQDQGSPLEPGETEYDLVHPFP